MKNQSFFKRVGFANHGIFQAMKMESSFRAQVIIAFLAIGMFVWLHATPVWWALLVVAISLVLSLELMNTALESALDLLHPDFHPTVRVAKDCAAGGVWIASLGAVALFIAFIFEARF